MCKDLETRAYLDGEQHGVEIGREESAKEIERLKREVKMLGADVSSAVMMAQANDEATKKADAEAEQLRVQLAGCSTAALGGTKDPAKQGDYGWSQAYQDTLDLRLKHDEADRKLEVLAQAARNLLEACYVADAQEELHEAVDGSLLDNVEAALKGTSCEAKGK